MATFSDRLRSLRRESFLSAKDLALNLDVAQSSISRYENGLREPRRDFLEKVSAYFNVSTDYLLGKTDDRSITTEDILPSEFKTAEEAVEFLLKQKTLVAFGGYDLNKLSNEEQIDFANDVLQVIKLVSHKYSK